VIGGIANAVSAYGFPTVVGALLIYIILRGEIVFRYPARRSPGEKR